MKGDMEMTRKIGSRELEELNQGISEKKEKARDAGEDLRTEDFMEQLYIEAAEGGDIRELFF